MAFISSFYLALLNAGRPAICSGVGKRSADTVPPVTTPQMYQIHETFYTKIKGLFVCEYDEDFVTAIQNAVMVFLQKRA